MNLKFIATLIDQEADSRMGNCQQMKSEELYNARDDLERHAKRLAAMEEGIEAVGAILEENGCDCDCDHHPEEHDPGCRRCLACRIDQALSKLFCRR